MVQIKQFLYRLANGWTILPFFMIVNITNRCNRRCEFCAYKSPKAADNEFNRWWGQHPKELSFDKFLAWLNGLGWKRVFIRRLSFSGKGEPLLHHEFMLFCHVANAFKIPFTVTTNGDFLTSIIIKRLQSYEYLREIRVSVYEQETFSRLSGYNKMKLYNFTGQGEDQMPLTTLYGIKADGCRSQFNLSSWCRIPFSFLTMYTDGTLVPCYSWRPIGSIRDSIWTLLNGREIRKFRNERNSGRIPHDADCKNCLIGH